MKANGLWRVLGWAAVAYCIAAVSAGVFFVGVCWSLHRVLPVDVDWSRAAAQVKPSLAVCLLMPLWLPPVVVAITAAGAVGCFRQARSQSGRGLVLFHALGALVVSAVLVGAELHLRGVGPVGVGPSTRLEWTTGDVIFSLACAGMLLLPAAAALAAMRRGHGAKRKMAG